MIITASVTPPYSFKFKLNLKSLSAVSPGPIQIGSTVASRSADFQCQSHCPSHHPDIASLLPVVQIHGTTAAHHPLAGLTGMQRQSGIMTTLRFYKFSKLVELEAETSKSRARAPA